MKVVPLALVVLALGVSACGGGEDEAIRAVGPESLANLAVSVDAPAKDDTLIVRRAFFLSDGIGAFLYDAAAAPSDDPAMGFTVGGDRVLDGWSWWIENDSTLLGAAERAHATVRPDFVVRSYAERDTSGFVSRLLNRIQGSHQSKISERITLLDEHSALFVEVPDSIGIVAFRPRFGQGQDAVILERGPTLLVARRSGADTLWTAIRAVGGNAGSREVAFATPGAVVVVEGRSAEVADSLAAIALRDSGRLKTERGERMAELLDESYVRTKDQTVNNALSWARLTLDALVVRDSAETVLMPGLPGAVPLPGRSILSNMPALLAIGDWATARSLLVAYGKGQLFDERLDVLGRAPNVVLPRGRAEFTTADATPIYLGAAADYVRTTGDRGLVSGGSNFWFKTAFAMRGLYQESNRHGRQIGDDGFLRAANGETWMRSPSAKSGLATPRGGFPVEAQGSLYRALRASAAFAGVMGVARREGSSWYADSAAVLLQDFAQRFIRNDRVVDLVEASGNLGGANRPNVVLALRDIDLPLEQKARLSRAVAEQLAYRHGLSTRVQSDSLFHPYLREPESYPVADALFNGTVWTWLDGPLISLMAQTGAPELASELFTQEASLVEHAGVVGAIPENLDAHPRKSGREPISGGTPVQPWSLAEFLNNAYEDFAGITYASADTVILQPKVPSDWGQTEARFRMGNGTVTIVINQDDNELNILATPRGALAGNAALTIRAFGLEADISLIASRTDSSAALVEPLTVSVSSAGVVVNGESVEDAGRYPEADPAWWEGFSWLEPNIQHHYPVMRTETGQRLLAAREILRDNQAARSILTEADPDGDDWGATATYTYPEGIPPSVLDGTYLEVAQDDSATYFRAEFVTLPETDSKSVIPTFVAIALNTASGGTNRVGRNAQYDFARAEGYEYVIFLGDGIVVEDSRRRVLGEVPPGQGTAFDPATASLSFALPRFVLPDLPRNSTVTMLIGARDDTGDVGSFERVDRTASGRFGGGKIDPRAPNVYDVLSARVSR